MEDKSRYTIQSMFGFGIDIIVIEEYEMNIKPICDVINYAYAIIFIATDPVYRDTNDKYQAENILIGINNLY